LLSISCAVKEGPPGGPEDKTPPAVIQVEPEPGSIMIPVDTRFTITFSKSMDRKKTESAVFLSPVFWDYPEMKWSGKKLTVIPPEDLEVDKTYVLTVGAGGVGHHRNKIGKSYSFAFSTGAEIDSGAIEGAVFTTEGGRKNYDIWVYSVDDTADVEFLTRIPEYATQVDSLGGFFISNIGPGHYLVIAVDDRNDDLFWEPGSESIGLPPFIVSVEGGESETGIVLRPERRDTLQAYFSRVKAVDNRRLIVEFSQPVLDSIMLNLESYLIKSSDDTTCLGILGAYIGEGKSLILETEPQTAELRYRLIAVNLISIWGVPFDTAGLKFEGSPLIDTIGPKLISTFPRAGSKSTYQDSVVELTFSERIKVMDFPAAVTVIADSIDTLQFTPDWVGPELVRLKILGRTPRQREIEVTLDPAGVFDIAGNPMPDSAVVFSFRLPPADTIGSVTASVEKPGTAPVLGILRPQNRGGDVYKSYSDKSGNISFDAMIPGSYRFEYFEDSDGDGRWTPGVIEPFKAAERFSFWADSISVRSRWTTDIGQIDLPGQSR
jgi:uncharacterized protein (DUF2141 family)